MDGENNGKTLLKMGWFGGETHYFRKHPYTAQKVFIVFSITHKYPLFYIGGLIYLGNKANERCAQQYTAQKIQQ